MNTNLSKQLREMADSDQKVVARRQKKGVTNFAELKRHTATLKKMMSKHGWPSVSMVGKDGAKSAWLIAQHSDFDIEFQKMCLQLMKDAYKKDRKDIVPTQIAFLTDRILANEKKPQKFGTQFYMNKDNIFTYWPIRDIKNVDVRRKVYGIEPLSEYIKDAKSLKLYPIKKT